MKLVVDLQTASVFEWEFHNEADAVAAKEAIESFLNGNLLKEDFLSENYLSLKVGFAKKLLSEIPKQSFFNIQINIYDTKD